MPLRDHFRPPVNKKASWEGFHGMWPASIVQRLRKQLPPGYVAEPRVHLGTLMEIDVGALESRPPNLEGEGAISIRDLVVNALRRWATSSRRTAGSGHQQSFNRGGAELGTGTFMAGRMGRAALARLHDSRPR